MKGSDLARINLDYERHVRMLRHTNRILVEVDEENPGNTTYEMIPFDLPEIP